MGVFKVRMSLSAEPGGPNRIVSALVDTGAFYTWVPRGLLDGLGLKPHVQRPFQLANGEIVLKDVGRAWAEIDGRQELTLVVFGDEGSTPLLGAYTLEGFALGVDPVNRRLIPIEALPMAASPAT